MREKNPLYNSTQILHQGNSRFQEKFSTLTSIMSCNGYVWFNLTVMVRAYVVVWCLKTPMLLTTEISSDKANAFFKPLLQHLKLEILYLALKLNLQIPKFGAIQQAGQKFNRAGMPKRKGRLKRAHQ